MVRVSIEVWSFRAGDRQPCCVFPGGVFGIPGFGAVLIGVGLIGPGLGKGRCWVVGVLCGWGILEQSLIQVSHCSKLVIGGMPKSLQEGRVHQGLVLLVPTGQGPDRSLTQPNQELQDHPFVLFAVVFLI